MEDILYKDLSYKLNGILFKAQNILGTKFQEKHYLKTACALLQAENILYAIEVPFQIKVNGFIVGSFRADLVVDGKILLELKTTDRLTNDHKMQLLRYLQALNLRLGLLVNFRIRPLTILRVVNKNGADGLPLAK